MTAGKAAPADDRRGPTPDPTTSPMEDTMTTPETGPETAAALAVADEINARRDEALRQRIADAMWRAAEHMVIAEWICCEPLNPRHDLCAKGYAALDMIRACILDSAEAAKPAPLPDAVLAIVLPLVAAERADAVREAADHLWALANRTTERGAGVLWAADRLRARAAAIRPQDGGQA